jgi:hypothetical protein
VWSRRWNEQTNESRTRFLGGVWKHDRNIAGDERRRLDLLLFSTEKRRPADSAPESDTNLLFGALGLHRREGRLSLSLFGAGRPAD